MTEVFLCPTKNDYFFFFATFLAGAFFAAFFVAAMVLSPFLMFYFVTCDNNNTYRNRFKKYFIFLLCGLKDFFISPTVRIFQRCVYEKDRGGVRAYSVLCEKMPVLFFCGVGGAVESRGGVS
jgi:hypothetical protein